MTILVIIKGRGREAIDACKSRGIEGTAIRTDIFGATHIEVADQFEPQLHEWLGDRLLGLKSDGSGYTVGTLLFFTKSKTEA